jgi:hypothetical protein
VFVALATSLSGGALVAGALWAAMLPPTAGEVGTAAGTAAPTMVKLHVPDDAPPATQPSRAQSPQPGAVPPSAELAMAPPPAAQEGGDGGYRSPTLAPPPPSSAASPSRTPAKPFPACKHDDQDQDNGRGWHWGWGWGKCH